MNGLDRVVALLTAVLGTRNTASEAEAIKANELAHAIARDLDRDIRWRPIEGAPKDGTLVLLARPKAMRWPAAVARYQCGWYDVKGSLIENATHFAFITPPEAT